MLRLMLVCASLVLATALPSMAQQAASPNPPPQPSPNPRPAPAAKPKPKPAAATAVKKPAAVVAAPADANAADNKAHMLEKIKDWSVFVHEGPEGRVCFAATAPTDMQPKTVKRTPVIFYVTTWQKDGIHNEVSVKQGYSLKPNSGATVTVGAQNFAMTAEDDKAFVKDPADERKIITAMSGGGTMTIKGVSAKGTATVDQYSLNGVPEAVQKLKETCP